MTHNVIPGWLSKEPRTAPDDGEEAEAEEDVDDAELEDENGSPSGISLSPEPEAVGSAEAPEPIAPAAPRTKPVRRKIEWALVKRILQTL